jgi:hypothetical protein
VTYDYVLITPNDLCSLIDSNDASTIVILCFICLITQVQLFDNIEHDARRIIAKYMNDPQSADALIAAIPDYLVRFACYTDWKWVMCFKNIVTNLPLIDISSRLLCEALTHKNIHRVVAHRQQNYKGVDALQLYYNDIVSLWINAINDSKHNRSWQDFGAGRLGDFIDWISQDSEPGSVVLGPCCVMLLYKHPHFMRDILKFRIILTDTDVLLRRLKDDQDSGSNAEFIKFIEARKFDWNLKVSRVKCRSYEPDDQKLNHVSSSRPHIE